MTFLNSRHEKSSSFRTALWLGLLLAVTAAGVSAYGCKRWADAMQALHPAVLFGAALLWAGEIITTILNFSPTWRDAMVRLVNAWGYSG